MFQKAVKYGFFSIFILSLVFLCLGAGVAGASQANELEAVLQNPAVTFEQAARFVISSAGIDTNVNTPEAAFKFAVEKGWLPKEASPKDPIKMAELSFLITSAFDIEGGFMYMFFPGPRYAFRTMVSRSLIQGVADPSMTVSGQRFLHILGNTIDYKGGE